ncbi:MAG: glycoside hydrolase family 26 protein [Bacteroidia bacterium]|nr:glycoside hydrolase family 26 protein [Bacteroidia bacterium]
MLFPLLISLPAGFVKAQLSISQEEAVELEPRLSFKASPKTRALHTNLARYAKERILFGQEDALAYGLHWKAEKKRSDVKDVTGSHPAVMGWDLSKIGQTPFNIDTVDFQKMRKWIKMSYKMGCINTISWHMDNPMTGGGSWDTTSAVRSILPGGEKHDFYLQKLDLVADYFKKLKAGFIFQQQIPIIFRPFHEHTGSWFWWGNDNCSTEDYIQLWRFTVDYLRKEKGLDNLLFAYAPDGVDTREAYLERYPGDDYVDIMGFDYYIHDNPTRKDPEELTKRLCMLVKLAGERGKIPAFTETGYSQIPDPDFWTNFLLSSIKSHPDAQKIAYLLVWRNARPDHHYAPFPGHHSAENFKKFHQDELIWLQSDLPDMYQKP